VCREGKKEREKKKAFLLTVLLFVARMKTIKHKILVLSGKGGVGKSTFSSQLSFALAEDESEVGLMDIDICGPSIPRMLGLMVRRLSPSHLYHRLYVMIRSLLNPAIITFVDETCLNLMQPSQCFPDVHISLGFAHTDLLFHPCFQGQEIHRNATGTTFYNSPPICW
jgi:hypothetical protein